MTLLILAYSFIYFLFTSNLLKSDQLTDSAPFALDENRDPLQGYLAHKKRPPSRSLQEAYP